MTTYYILPIKAELFYIFFMETVPSHNLKDATVWDIFLVVLCSPASSGAVSGFSGEYIKSRMHTGSSRSSRQARGMVWLNFPRSKLYRKVMNQNSCTVVCNSAMKTSSPLWPLASRGCQTFFCGAWTLPQASNIGVEVVPPFEGLRAEKRCGAED